MKRKIIYFNFAGKTGDDKNTVSARYKDYIEMIIPWQIIRVSERLQEWWWQFENNKTGDDQQRSDYERNQ